MCVTHMLHYPSLSSLQGHVIRLSEKAKDYFKSGDTEEARQCYFDALEVCQQYPGLLTEQEASIHSSLAHIYLQAKDYVNAYRQADTCIAISKKNAKVSF